MREAAVVARGDTELYEGRRIQAVDDGLKADERHDERMAAPRAAASGLQRQPCRAKAGHNVTQMHYARKGIITPEMEFVALRETSAAWTSLKTGAASVASTPNAKPPARQPHGRDDPARDHA